MEHASRWVIVGVLSYIGVVLTSINDKVGRLDLQNTEFAVLDEVKTQSFTGAELADTSQAFTPASMNFPYTLVALCFAALTIIFATWHLSRLYHNQQWTKKILRKSYAYRREPIVDLHAREILHEDQDAIFEKPLPDGRITDGWLPPRAQKLYESWGRGNS